jgi:hypothetical protein
VRWLPTFWSTAASARCSSATFSRGRDKGWGGGSWCHTWGESRDLAFEASRKHAMLYVDLHLGLFLMPAGLAALARQPSPGAARVRLQVRLHSEEGTASMRHHVSQDHADRTMLASLTIMYQMP